MSYLVGRIRCKQFARIAEADTVWDPLLDALRGRASRDAEEVTGRVFDEEVDRVEYHESYEQIFGDPMPQYVIPDRPPIDVNATTALVFAPFDDHETNGVTLTQSTGSTDGDWRFELDRNGDAYALRIQRFASWPLVAPIPAGRGALLTKSPTGFRLTYTGGYTVSTGSATDPLEIGEEDVVGVPAALSDLIALKTANDWKHLRQVREGVSPQDVAALVAAGAGASLVRPWSAAEMEALQSWKRKDLSWIGPDYERRGALFGAERVRVTG